MKSPKSSLINTRRSRRSMVRAVAGASFAIAWGGWGCLSMQSQTSLDGATTTVTPTNQPYVEAYVEYPGPQPKWSGPASFILHVTAKDAGAAQITMTPALTSGDAGGQDGTTSSHRNPANVAGAPTTAFHPMSSEEARDQLSHLVSALQGAQAPFRGCMSPVRVRLVRADGGIFERQGCRSELGWSRAVSETVSSFVQAALHGTTTAQRQAIAVPQDQSHQAVSAPFAASIPAAASASAVVPPSTIPGVIPPKTAAHQSRAAAREAAARAAASRAIASDPK